MTNFRIAIGAILILSTAAAAATLDVPAAYSTIQAAVDVAAAGDTILVAPGAYEEQVVITTSVVLRGAGKDLTIVQAPTDLTHAIGYSEYRAVISVETPADAVTVTDLTIDGQGRGPATGRMVGLLLYETGGRVADVNVVNIHHTPVTTDASGIGIVATQGAFGPDHDIELTDVHVSRFQKSAVVIWGWGYSVDINRLDVDTDGLLANTVQNGIELGFESRATITDCTFHNIRATDSTNPGYTSCAVLAYYNAPIVIRDCVMDECQAGVYLIHTPADIDRVAISADSGPSAYCHGVVSVATIYRTTDKGDAKSTLPRPLPTFDDPPADKVQTTWDLNMRDCVLDGRDRSSSRGIALRATSSEAQVFNAERCDLLAWETGIMALEELPGAVYARITASRLVDNQSFGAYANTLTPLDARGCWWGHKTGPYHPWDNPYGLGDSAGDHVLFDPWVEGNLAPFPLPQIISLADFDGAAYSDTVSVEYLGGGEDQLYGYSAEIHWDPAVLTAVSITRPSRGSFADAVLFQVLPVDGGAVIDAALGGDRSGIDAGALFDIRFETVGLPDWTAVPLELQLHHVRDRQNRELSGFNADSGTVIVDLKAPTLDGLKIINQTLLHTDDFAKNSDMLAVTVQATDASPDFGLDGIRGIGANIYGSLYAYFPPDSYVGNQAIWAARHAVLTPNNGPAPFRAEARDPAGNVSEMVVDMITADNSPPAMVAGFAGSADHNAIHLRWDDATGNDLYYRQTVIRAARWGGYPFYDDAPPAFPSTPGAGELVYAGDDTAVDPTYAADGSERDILFITATVEDIAGNTSPINSETRVCLTNYRLGDVRGEPTGSVGDGIIDLYDMTRLGDTFGLIRADLGFDGDCDIAPVATGIPEPDEVIDLDDLMVFADQFDLDQPPASVPAAGESPQLVWQQVAPSSWALILTEPCPRLKGLSLGGDDLGAELHLSAGALLHDQPTPWFLHPGTGGCQAHAAVLGHGAGFVGSGELLRLSADAPIDLPPPTLELRDVDNEPLDSNLPTSIDQPGDVPAVFRVGRPFPNPFNPSTTIAFELPVAVGVRLEIYSLDGRRVRTLLAADLQAGRHTACWDARDQSGRAVAAGTYLYRLDAGARTARGKLELIK